MSEARWQRRELLQEADIVLKTIVIGESGVGKTSIVRKLVKNEFDENEESTIGCDFSSIMVNTGGSNVKVVLWDTSGQERFRTLAASYYRAAQLVILVFDVSNRKSFVAIESWLEESEMYMDLPAVKILVANKSDLLESAVTAEEASLLARKHKMRFVSTSAKNGSGIKEMINTSVQKVLKTPALLDSSVKTSVSVVLNRDGKVGERCSSC